jgi:hypothetical protein
MAPLSAVCLCNVAQHHPQEQQESPNECITMQSPLQQYMHNLLLSKKFQAGFSKLTLIVDTARPLTPPPPRTTVVDEKPSSRRDLFSKSVSDRSIFQKVRHCRWTPEELPPPPPVMPSTRKMKSSSRRDLFSKSVSDRSIWNDHHTQAPRPVTPSWRPREKGFYVRQSSDSALIMPERRRSSLSLDSVASAVRASSPSSNSTSNHHDGGRLLEPWDMEFDTSWYLGMQEILNSRSASIRGPRNLTE